jgi:WD40 repeat protein
LKGHSGEVCAALFSRNGKYLWTASSDATTRIWDVAMGKELCRVVHFRDGTWAVCDGEGRYDCSDDGNNSNLYWIIGSDILQISKFKDHYYDPGLLSKYLGLNKEAPRVIQ